MNNINEGQTQVYANGMVTPQYGVNTNAPYLNTPPQQLMDITNEFFKSGKSPSQVLAILVGMGTPQQLAKTAIETYAIGAMQENQQKNHNKMFTLTELYERVNKTATELKTVAILLLMKNLRHKHIQFLNLELLKIYTEVFLLLIGLIQ